MRADRLLALLMLLQNRGRLTARQLAEELEVSERTIYRDIVALNSAGVPVYSQSGPEGGFELVDSYRTDLTGLSPGEVRALFMLNISEALVELGIGRELKAALLKLSAALPDSRRQDEERVRKRFYLDARGWRQGEEGLPHLESIHQAVWDDLRVWITYRFWSGTEIERLVEPYGLVAKAGVWYLVCAWGGRARVHRVSNLLQVRLTDEHFERPVDFDLAAFWRAYCQEREAGYTGYAVTVRVAVDFLPALRYHFGERLAEQIQQASPADAHGQVTLQLHFESLEAARERLLGFGRGVEVLEPYALRCSIVDIAEQILGIYEPIG